MITIFNGRKLSLDGTQDEVYVQIAATLRAHIHEFNTGKSLSPFGVFMAIALHTDQDGWTWPGRALLKKETGISGDATLGSAIKHLAQMRIDGHRVLAVYRLRDPKTKLWRGSLYRLFPDAAKDKLDSLPEGFLKYELVPYEPQHNDPHVDHSKVDPLKIDILPHKNNQTPSKTILEEDRVPPGNTSPVTNSVTNDEPPKPKRKKHKTAKAAQTAINKHPAIQAYREAAHLYPPASWRPIIIDTIGDEPDDLQRWARTTLAWVGMGWSPKNARGMIDCYARNEIPGENNGNHRQGRGASGPRAVALQGASKELAAALATPTGRGG